MAGQEGGRRRSLRRDSHHYQWHATYFVTIVTARRMCWFGDIVDGHMVANPIGAAVVHEWLKASSVRPGVLLGTYALMPNHLHAIVEIPAQMEGWRLSGVEDTSASRGWQQPALDRVGRPKVSRSLGALVRGLKAAATSRAREIRQLPEPWDLWQRNYHEHIIRDVVDRRRVERYIEANPSRWEFDSENVEARPDELERSFWKSLDS